MNEIQRQRWEQVRAKGQDNFIWMTGVLRWGILSGSVISTLMYLFKHNWNVSVLLGMDFVTYLSFSLLLFSVFGYLWGRLVWWLTEKKYLGQ